MRKQAVVLGIVALVAMVVGGFLAQHPVGAPAHADEGEAAPKAEPVAEAAAPAAEAEAEASPQATLHAAANGHAADCGDCHVSAEPTHDSHELKACTRPRSTANGHSADEAADVIYMDELSDIYVPVVFPHKLHASMTEMSGGCETCHHNNPPGRILRCGECHGGPSNPVNLEQPGLKGAYHRQCLGCHREWTHETDCAVCHAKREPGEAPPPPPSPDDIMGRLHPNVEEPDTKVYTVEDMADTPVVTFQHKQHVEAYALKCVECHREENCSSCHDSERPRAPHVRQDPHEDCASCHEKEIADNCAYCHKAEQTAGFDHASLAGHKLAPYHEQASCRGCHEGTGRFQKAETECSACHAADWEPEDFDHTVTGTALDELHTGLGCADCHPDGLGKPATCANCHDDGRKTFPGQKEADAAVESEQTPAGE